MTSVIGIIGGSGFYSLATNADSKSSSIPTPYSDSPVEVFRQSVAGCDAVFLPRHGNDHGIPPHKVNYRANVWALREAGVTSIISANVVGGITEKMSPGTIVIPEQLIDYTWGRAHTYFDILEEAANHVDFTWPYDRSLAAVLAQCAEEASLNVLTGAVYGCTQGPRLESGAEINRLKNDGCDIVGMTGMPEAALARELDIPYASIALVVNWGAGIRDESISFADISATLDSGIAQVRQVVVAALGKLA